MTIDTIRHVTPFGANLFLELGFAPAEARRLQAVSAKQIDDQIPERAAHERVASWIALHHLKQSDAARILVVSRPRVSDVVNKKTAKFTIDALVEMLGRTGKSTIALEVVAVMPAIISASRVPQPTRARTRTRTPMFTMHDAGAAREQHAPALPKNSS